MVMENLPRELVDYIALLLNQEERCSCLQVCKKWYSLLLPNLYMAVHITSLRSMDCFWTTLLRSSSMSQPLGQHVQQVVFGRGSKSKQPIRADELRGKTYRLGLSWSRWSSLAQLCPNIEYMDFNWSTWFELEEANKKNAGRNLFPWESLRGIAPFHRLTVLQQLLDSHGAQLTRLELARAVLEQVFHWKDILKQTPVLQELRLTTALTYGTLMTGPMFLALEDVLRACPDTLRSLYLSGFRLDVKEEVENIKIRHAPLGLKRIDLYMVDFLSPGPFDYIANTCRRLETLTISRSSMSSLGSTNRADNDIPKALIHLFHQCQSLKYLSVGPLFDSQWILPILLAIRQKSLLEFHTGSHAGLIQDSPGMQMTPDAYRVMLRALSPYASSVEVSVWSEIRSIHELTQPLHLACPCLFSLELKGAMHPIALDAILRDLPNLHRLSLHSCNVVRHSWETMPAASSSSAEAAAVVVRKGGFQLTSVLQSCGFYQSTVRSEVFDYLAATCPKLSHLRIQACYYRARLPSVCLAINMPNHHLHQVMIQSISAVLEIVDPKDPTTVYNRSMGKCFAFGISSPTAAEPSMVYHQVSNQLHSFTRTLLPFPFDFPYLAPLALPARGSKEKLEDIQKDWLKYHRHNRQMFKQGSIPEKSFGYVALQAASIHHCAFEDAVVL